MGRTQTQSARASKTYQLVPIDDLTGGVDLRRAPSLMQPTRARTLRNFSISEPGALKAGFGHVQYSTTSLGNSPLQGGERVYLSSNVFTLVGYQGGIYKPADANGAPGSAVGSSRSTGNQMYFPYDRDLVAVFDGANRPLKSGNAGAGSSWTLMGIDSPSSAAVLSSVSSGTFIAANEYEITYAYVDTELGHVSNESSGLSTITMTDSGALKVVVSNSTDSQTDEIYIYARNKTAGESVRRRAASVTQSTTGSGGTSTSVITSTAWTANAEAPTNHDVPLAWAHGVVWKNRWWAKHPTIGNRLHFTEIWQPQSWPTLYYVDIPFEKGDSIQAIVAQGDTLVVFGKTKPYLIIGETSLDFTVKPSLGETGALGPRAAVAIENGVIHASYEGVYIFDGTTDRLLSFDIEPAWRDLVQNTANATLEKLALVYEEQYKQIRIAVPRLYPTGTYGEWVLDLNRTRLTEEAAWTSTDRAVAGYLQWTGSEAAAGNKGRLFSWSPTVGVLNEESKGTSRNSSNLTATYEGPTLTSGRHRARWVDTLLEFRQSAGTLSAELSVDGVRQGAQSISIGSGLIFYNDSSYTYGDSSRTYGGRDRSIAPMTQPLTADGYAAKLTLTYTGQDEFKQYTYAHGIVPEVKPRGL